MSWLIWGAVMMAWAAAGCWLDEPFRRPKQ